MPSLSNSNPSSFATRTRASHHHRSRGAARGARLCNQTTHNPRAPLTHARRIYLETCATPAHTYVHFIGHALDKIPVSGAHTHSARARRPIDCELIACVCVCVCGWLSVACCARTKKRSPHRAPLSLYRMWQRCACCATTVSVRRDAAAMMMLICRDDAVHQTPALRTRYF